MAIPKVQIPKEHVQFPAPVLPRPVSTSSDPAVLLAHHSAQGKLPPPLKLMWGKGITAGKTKKQKATSAAPPPVLDGRLTERTAGG